ncbi:hypothetical protein [Methylorubrum salsuginis]|uniref:hypothetical protein n=1 Tax=Methylorubrum salsuginis TaxID=414703 RepID=UPI001041CDFB|nr:hypothetical protein [Methylorubrum salsuginis]
MLLYIGVCETTDGAVMAVETKDLIGWAVTGGIGLWSLYLNWRTRRDTKKREKRQADAVWKLRRSKDPVTEGGLTFLLTLKEPKENAFRMLSMQVLKPRGSLIAPAKGNWDGGKFIGYSPKDYAKKWIVDADIKPDTRLRSGGPYTANESTFRFFVSETASWWLRRMKRRRLVVAVEVESISSSAEVMRLKIRSEEIDWTASATDSTR